MKYILILVLAITTICLLAYSRSEGEAAKNQHRSIASIHSLRIIVLSTMLAGNPGNGGIGEWGYAALVEADGHQILFDTGARPDTVLKNSQELGIDLSTVQDVILSHNHFDHISGLLTLRHELAKKNPTALSRVHVGTGIFWSRPSASGEDNLMIALKPAYETADGVFVEHNEPREIFPGAWLTGPVPRTHPERNWSVTGRVQTPNGLLEDTIPEDMSLVFNTDQGLVVVSGCGHAGIINTLEYARKVVRQAPVYAAIGGFHLFQLDDDKLNWTIGKLREFGLKQFLGGHCTGIEAVYRIRQLAALNRQTCVVSAVGSTFTLEHGIDPLLLAR